MSTAALCAIFKTRATVLTEYRNGHGTGPAIWGYLREKFLRRNRYDSYGDDEPLWRLAENPDVPLCLRACHVLTFDYALTRPGDMQVMAKLVGEGGALLDAWSPDTVNHFPRIADHMRELKLDRRALGVGLCCTSVADVWRAWKPGTGSPFDCYAAINKAPGDQP